MSCSRPAARSVCAGVVVALPDGDGSADADRAADGLGLVLEVAEALDVAARDVSEGAVVAAVPPRTPVDGPLAAVERGLVVLVPAVVRGVASAVRRAVLVGFEAAVVGLGAAVVRVGCGAGAGAAGRTEGADPEPNRKPTDEPGRGSWLPAPLWL